ncbi:hypothetical protein J4407_00535 [Candidatus Pacearchaeota archaeon]|nr:hypothetical protein [Candidatus Pacearchaeota archaeon]
MIRSLIDKILEKEELIERVAESTYSFQRKSEGSYSSDGNEGYLHWEDVDWNNTEWDKWGNWDNWSKSS